MLAGLLALPELHAFLLMLLLLVVVSVAAVVLVIALLLLLADSPGLSHTDQDQGPSVDWQCERAMQPTRAMTRAIKPPHATSQASAAR